MADPVDDVVVRRAGRVFGHGSADGGPLAIVVRDGAVERVVPDADVDVDLPELDAGGRAVIPGFVDAHTHLVFAGDRCDEFEARLVGRPYAAGGIMRTVAATRAASFDELVEGLVGRAAAALAMGTTTIEVKSGYGLDVAHERRLLEVVAAAGARTPVEDRKSVV